MLEDILVYFEGDQEEEFDTNQHMIGIKNLFKGYAVKAQKEANFSTAKYKTLNKKIVAKHCVYYHKVYQECRNNALYNDKIQRQRLTKQYRNLKRQV